MPTVYAGIDVSHRSLAIAILDQRGRFKQFTVPNTPAGHREVARRLKRGSTIIHVVMEATSTYNLDLALCLHKQEQLIVSVINPKQGRDFARAALQRAKTDPLDACGLALFAQRMQPPAWEPPSELALQLRGFSRRIAKLVEERTAECSRRGAASATKLGGDVVDSCNRILTALEAEIKRLEGLAVELIDSDPQLAKSFEYLQTVKGIGVRSGIGFLGEISCLPEGMQPAQWVALAGLDPKPIQSGSSIHPPWRISRQGSPHLRRLLYMPMLTATRYEPSIKACYDRLLARGKPHRVAQCAVMRRMLHAIWGMLHNREPFIPAKFAPHLV